MLVIDDTLLFPLALAGVELLPMPNLYLLVLTTLRNQTLEQMYPLEATQDAVKENRLRFELGETTQPEYAAAHASLLDRLRIAKRVREMVEEWRANVFGGRIL